MPDKDDSNHNFAGLTTVEALLRQGLKNTELSLVRVETKLDVQHRDFGRCLEKLDLRIAANERALLLMNAEKKNTFKVIGVILAGVIVLVGWGFTLWMGLGK